MKGPQDRPEAIEGGRASAPRGRRLGPLLGAGAAALISAGLVYWIGATDDRSFSTLQSKGVSSPPRVYAPSKVDPEQVVRAFEQLQEIYADQGVRGVVDFARSCANSLQTDPSVLDFCLAFDIYADPLEGENAAARAWRAGADARDLALAQSVLPPGIDAAARLTQVRGLAHQTGLEAPNPVSSPAPPEPSRQIQPPARPIHAVRPKPARKGGAACRLRATAAQRTICASPALREADRRLRLTYRHALAAGVGPRKLAREQARFRAAVNAAGADRTAVARLYHRRLRTLEAQIRRVRHRVD